MEQVNAQNITHLSLVPSLAKLLMDFERSDFAQLERLRVLELGSEHSPLGLNPMEKTPSLSVYELDIACPIQDMAIMSAYNAICASLAVRASRGGSCSAAAVLSAVIFAAFQFVPLFP